MADDYQLRGVRDGDMPYVFATWMRWARASAPWLRLLPDRVFWSDRHGYRAHVEATIKRAKVTVACDPEAPDNIFGYVVAEAPRLLHFVYVDRVMRGRAGGTLAEGIGTGLLKAALPMFGREEVVTTLDRPAFSVMARKWRLRFDPFAAPISGGDFKQWARAWRESLSTYTGEEVADGR